jgi:Domain of unknown function (DUF1707)
MPGDPRMRASDADREKTGELLREHHAVGRLTAEEFSERLDQVYAAKTLGELDALLADLPAIDLYQPPSASIRPGPSARRPSRRREGPGANLDRSADNGLARFGAGRMAWAGVTAVAVLAWVGLAVASGGAAAWLVWFLVIVIPVAVAAAFSRRRSRPLSGAGRGPVSGTIVEDGSLYRAVALRRSLSRRNTTRGVGVMPSGRVRGMTAVDYAAAHRLAFRQALCSLSCVLTE